MLDNPIYNTPNTGVKGTDAGIKTAQYQFVRLLRGSVKILEIVVRALIQLGKDVVKGIFKS